MCFNEFLVEYYGLSNWCVATRATPKLVARYGHVFTRKQYDAAGKHYADVTGIPRYGRPVKAK